MEGETLKSIVESLLFVAEGPLTLQRLAEVIEGADKVRSLRRWSRSETIWNRTGAACAWWRSRAGISSGLRRKTLIG